MPGWIPTSPPPAASAPSPVPRGCIPLSSAIFALSSPSLLTDSSPWDYTWPEIPYRCAILHLTPILAPWVLDFAGFLVDSGWHDSKALPSDSPAICFIGRWCGPGRRGRFSFHPPGPLAQREVERRGHWLRRPRGGPPGRGPRREHRGALRREREESGCSRGQTSGGPQIRRFPPVV